MYVTVFFSVLFVVPRHQGFRIGFRDPPFDTAASSANSVSYLRFEYGPATRKDPAVNHLQFSRFVAVSMSILRSGVPVNRVPLGGERLSR